MYTKIPAQKHFHFIEKIIQRRFPPNSIKRCLHCLKTLKNGARELHISGNFEPCFSHIVKATVSSEHFRLQNKKFSLFHEEHIFWIMTPLNNPWCQISKHEFLLWNMIVFEKIIFSSIFSVEKFCSKILSTIFAKKYH